MASVWTAADLEALERAIAGGAAIESMTMTGGTVVTFRSMDDMLKLRSTMKAELEAEDGTRTTHRYASVSSGL